MVKGLIKFVFCLCVLFSGCSVFAASLSNVEIVSAGSTGKIILDTDKSFVNKKLISQNEIQIKLKNTGISENLKTVYNNAPKNTEISVMQNGKNTYINISGENVSDYTLLYADDESLIPVKNGKKDILIATVIFAIISLFLTASKKINEIKGKLSTNASYFNVETAQRQKNQIQQINTLRNKINQFNHNIHGNPVSNFANNEKLHSVSMPQGLKNSKIKYIEYPEELKKVVNS